MESRIELETVEIIAKVEQNENEFGEKEIAFVLENLNETKVVLSNSDVNDIKYMFDEIFKFILTEEKFIQLKLDSSREDLFNEVAKDLVEHLNNEISQSKENFKKLISMKSADSQNDS